MFAVGDVVQLKSGGPRMTVLEVEDGHVITTWFEESNARQGGFPFATVRKVDDGPSVLHPNIGTIA